MAEEVAEVAEEMRSTVSDRAAGRPDSSAGASTRADAYKPLQALSTGCQRSFVPSYPAAYRLPSACRSRSLPGSLPQATHLPGHVSIGPALLKHRLITRSTFQ